MWRQGKKVQLTADLGRANAKATAAAAPQSGDEGRLGLALRPLNPQERLESKRNPSPC